MIVVGDISALTALARIDQLELLRHLQRQVVVPEGVRNEFVRAHSRLPWYIKVQQPTNSEHVGTLRRWLDSQEAEAIALYKELNADVLLMDEHLGRRLAHREGVRLLGLLGLLLLAKRAGHISSVRDVVTQVRRACGFQVTNAAENLIFQHAGE